MNLMTSWHHLVTILFMWTMNQIVEIWMTLNVVGQRVVLKLVHYIGVHAIAERHIPDFEGN